uniref:(California timema) hypothetical protein n=1 Tax=Timema californicum TaxID=61474 RepID=A0A7R9J4K7_TIMCA|nr:unnamed protein product [Timema californicum]
MVQKKSGSTQPGRAGCNLCGLWNNILCIRCSYICNDLCGKWHQRWFFIKDTFMGYITPKDGRVKCVMLFDLGFEVSSGMYATGLHHGLQLVNLTRHLQIKCWTRRKRKEWLAFIKDVATGSGTFLLLLGEMGPSNPRILRRFFKEMEKKKIRFWI